MKAGWEEVALGDIAEFVNGRAYKKPELLDVGTYPVLRVGNFFTNRNWYYSNLELPAKNYCDTGDLLYAWSASFGPRVWDGGKCIFHYHIWKVVPDPERVSKAFLYHLLDWDKELIKEEQGAGATMVHVSKRSMEARLVPLPPLEEQQRIVAILDEAFEGLNRAKANAEANLASARELFEAALSELFETQSAPKVPLSSLTTDRGITYGVIKLGDHQDDGVPCLRTSNVRQLSIDTEGIKRISPTLSAEYGRTVLRGGEVLVNVRGTLGGVATVPQEMIGWNMSREVAMVAVDAEKADPDFISTFIATSAAQQWLTGVVKGATYKGINLADLRNLPIPLLSSSEQASLASKAKALRASRTLLKDALHQKLGALDQLRQSLLAKAFAGELT